MKTFAQYFKDLLEWEGVKFQELISAWPERLITEVIQKFGESVGNSQIINSLCPSREKSSNQSIGNQLADYTVEKLNKNIRDFKIEKCNGKGYPDNILAESNVKQIAFEMKATSSWDSNDSNRRVLTSSSIKLRNNFAAPIYHLICTVIYNKQENSCQIEKIRLDFIEPYNQVSVRLEASVNHKILDNGEHKSIVFGNS